MPGRGRGGRGRGGRGRWRGRRTGYGSNDRGSGREPTHNQASITQDVATDEDLEKCPELLFTASNVTFEQHLTGQEKNRNVYLATLQVLLNHRVEIPQGMKVKALAAAWARKDHSLARALLDDPDTFTLVEVLKALMVLDAGRRMREKERRLRQLQVLIQDQVKIRPKKMSKVKSDIDNLNANKCKVGSVSGALSRHIRQWVRGLSPAHLEFYALHYPKEPWQKLADICHLNPAKDFPEKPWFLSYCFGEPAPADSLAARCASMSADNINELVQATDVPYSHIKHFNTSLNEESKVRIATYEEKVDTLIWFYEDLHCAKVDEKILERLTGGEAVMLPSAKLMERLLMMKTRNIGGAVLEALIPEAEKRLKAMKVPLEAPVAILGDRSPSMEVAIKTSSIVACLLTAITDAKLSFFSNIDYVPPELPKTIPQVLDMASTLRTHGGTSPAAGLWPYYERKEIIKTFVLVTDEEENGQVNNYNFHMLFKKYLAEVYADAKLVFISFLYDQHAAGQMVSALTRDGIRPMQFKFSRNRPDLTKLDSILGLLSMTTTEFRQEVQRRAGELTDEDDRSKEQTNAVMIKAEPAKGETDDIQAEPGSAKEQTSDQSKTELAKEDTGGRRQVAPEKEQ